MLQILSNFIEIKSITNVIFVLNLKEIKAQEDGSQEF